MHDTGTSAHSYGPSPSTQSKRSTRTAEWPCPATFTSSHIHTLIFLIHESFSSLVYFVWSAMGLSIFVDEDSWGGVPAEVP